jgi:SAM-dependent methyltransferase
MSSFDNLSLVYDRSINWDARLGRELPFILNALSESGGNRILDMACGSGRHSVALALKGADVVGFDSSTAMIQAAKELAAENGVEIRFMVADMTNLETILKEKFDLIICLGNSLALVPALQEAKNLLSAVHSRLNSDGVFVAQVLNFEQIKKTKSRFFQPKGGVTSEGNLVIFARFFNHLEPEESTTLVLTSFVKSSEGWSTIISSQSVLQLDQEALTQAVRAVGFGQFEVYSDYGGNPFASTEHRNLVIKARK